MAPPESNSPTASVAKGRRPVVTVNPVHRQLNVFQITEDELVSLYASGNYKTLDSGMFSLSLGAAITLAATLMTVDIANAKLNAAFVAALIVSLLASVFFGSRAVIAWRTAAQTLKAIKQTASA